MSEEFNEKFETIEQTLKYIADSQAKFELRMKKKQKKWKKSDKKFEKKELKIQKRFDNITKRLEHIAKLRGINLED